MTCSECCRCLFYDMRTDIFSCSLRRIVIPEKWGQACLSCSMAWNPPMGKSKYPVKSIDIESGIYFLFRVLVVKPHDFNELSLSYWKRSPLILNHSWWRILILSDRSVTKASREIKYLLRSPTMKITRRWCYLEGTLNEIEAIFNIIFFLELNIRSLPAVFLPCNLFASSL